MGFLNKRVWLSKQPGAVPQSSGVGRGRGARSRESGGILSHRVWLLKVQGAVCDAVKFLFEDCCCPNQGAGAGGGGGGEC